jgi:hypothetical protein
VLSIVGDPYFLVSTNFISSTAFVQILFNAATDYDLDTGLLDISDRISFSISDSQKKSSMGKGLVFAIKKVESTFSNGEFTQRLTMTETGTPSVYN